MCSGSSSDDVVEEEEEEASHSGHKQKDKDWAALTTWLRMNLHHVSARAWPSVPPVPRSVQPAAAPRPRCQGWRPLR
jgi:hypothetical protein